VCTAGTARNQTTSRHGRYHLTRIGFEQLTVGAKSARGATALGAEGGRGLDRSRRIERGDALVVVSPDQCEPLFHDRTKRTVVSDTAALGLLPAFAIAEELRLGSLIRLDLRPPPPRMRLRALLSPSEHPALNELLEVIGHIVDSHGTVSSARAPGCRHLTETRPITSNHCPWRGTLTTAGSRRSRFLIPL
jgi:DNA-binding transcriptional LysR family regulator